GPQRFELLGNIVDDPCNFAVHSDTPVRTLQELAAYARSNPGKVTVGTTGIGSDDHLLMLMFERAAGVKMTHVPFKGSADVRTALASKQIEVAAINVGESLQASRGGCGDQLMPSGENSSVSFCTRQCACLPGVCLTKPLRVKTRRSMLRLPLML